MSGDVSIRSAKYTLTVGTVVADIDTAPPQSNGASKFEEPPSRIYIQQGGNLLVDYVDGTSDTIVVNDGSTLDIRIARIKFGTTAVNLAIHFYK